MIWDLKINVLFFYETMNVLKLYKNMTIQKFKYLMNRLTAVMLLKIGYLMYTNRQLFLRGNDMQLSVSGKMQRQYEESLHIVVPFIL